MNNNEFSEIEESLLKAQKEWERRLGAIRADRRHERLPLDRDLEDQAIQLQNDEALDALDEQGQRELGAIQSALQRIATHTYGGCLSCGEPIADRRLRAYPTARRCVICEEPRPVD